MRKKIRFKSLATSALFTLACLGTAAYFFNLFWRDLNAYSARSDKKPVATLTFKNRVAQRKFDDRVVWERISQNAPLYDGDTISTADLAEATLHFSDGTKLDLYENTMVKLSLNADGGLDLNVSGGDIQVDTKETAGEAKVSVSLGDGSKVALQKGSVVAVARGSGGKAGVSVQDGSATVTGADGGSAAIASGESALVAEGGAVQKRTLSVTYPPKELTLFSRADDRAEKEVRIVWKSGGGANDSSAAGASVPVIVQTSGVKDFSALASEQAVTDGGGATITVKQSPLYWRVIDAGANAASAANAAAGAESNGAALSESAVAAGGRITVERLSLPEPLSPAPKTVFRYKNEVPAVALRWSEVPFAERYALAVSQNADMTGPVFERTLSEPFAEFTPDGEGVYYWRVVPLLSREAGFSLESGVSQFLLEKAESILDVGAEVGALAENQGQGAEQSAENSAAAQAAKKAEEAPKPAEPPASETRAAPPPRRTAPPRPAALSRPYLASPQYNLLVDNDYLKKSRAIYFYWRPVSGAAGYTFEIYKVDGNGRERIFSRAQGETSLTLSDLSILSDGTFEWSVTANPAPRSAAYLASRAATSVFSVSLSSPQKIDVSEPEGVYGN